jgi:ELWxxDGT repeat protein
MKNPFSPHIGVLLAALGAAASAQGPAILVRDINMTAPATQPNSNPRFFYTNGGLMLFAGTDADNGQELWRSDGTPAGTFMIKDLNPGPGDGAPFGFTELTPGVYLFQGSDATIGTNGGELWRTDGTAAGTQLVADIRPGPDPSMQFPVMVVVNGIAYFSATDGVNGFELWRSDGTTAGTFMVRDVNAGSLNHSPNNLTVLGTTIYYRGSEASVGAELFRSDGTAAGTVVVQDLNPGTASSTPGNFALYNGRVYFGCFTPTLGNELWSTDGVTTTNVVDLQMGTPSGTPTGLVVWNGNLYFTANDGVAGSELWRWDGTTATVIDVVAGATGSFPGFLTPVGSNLFFQANDATTGLELYKYDGTTAALVADINPAGNSSPSRLTNVSGTLVFRADDGTNGSEPWRSDGTPAGTFLLQDISPGPGGSLSDFFTPFLGFAYFQAVSPAVGQELFRTDGTVAGTTLFKDINPPTPSSSPATIVDSRGTQFAIFAANDGVAGLELWGSDGTAGGTAMIKDINVGAGGAVIGNLTTVSSVTGNKVFFTADDGTATTGRELYVSDGTAAGTGLVLDIRVGSLSSLPFNLTEFKGRCYFSAPDGVNGSELWASDGTAAGTVIVLDILPGSGSSSPSNFKVVNNRMFFSASDGTTAPGAGTELWATDGTGAGTVRVADINPGTASSLPNTFFAFQDKLFFTASVTATGRELYVSDGTAAGTMLLVDINTGSGSSNPVFLGTAVGRLFFTAQTTTNGVELWSTDGTAVGTSLVRDIAPGVINSNPTGFADLGGFGVFFANDTVSGFEPWRTDGTTAGTTQIADIRPGLLGSLPLAGSLSTRTFVVAVPGSGRAIFAASDGTSGVELWRTDGTLAGTVLHQDIAPGVANSNPTSPTQAGCLLFFAASTAVGDELWAMVSTASASPYGIACPGTGGRFPHISGSGGPPALGNAGFGIRVSNALASSFSFCLVHAGRGELPLSGGCTYYGNPVTQVFALAVPVSGSGVGTLGVPIPNLANLACVQLFAQHAVLDTGAPNGIVALTEGLKVLLAPN